MERGRGERSGISAPCSCALSRSPSLPLLLWLSRLHARRCLCSARRRGFRPLALGVSLCPVPLLAPSVSFGGSWRHPPSNAADHGEAGPSQGRV